MNFNEVRFENFYPFNGLFFIIPPFVSLMLFMTTNAFGSISNGNFLEYFALGEMLRLRSA